MLIDMANKFLTAAVAGAMLAPSVKAQERVEVQNVEDTTKSEIVDALSREDSGSETEISLEDANLQLKIAEAFKNLSSKDKENLGNIMKYYWEDEFDGRLINIAKIIEQNPNAYWTFDAEWWYFLKEDSMKDLLKSEFSEYFEKMSQLSEIALIISLSALFISFLSLGVSIGNFISITR